MERRLIIVTTNFYDFYKNEFIIGGLETYIRDLALLAIENNIKVLVFQVNNSSTERKETEYKKIKIISFLPSKRIFTKNKNQLVFDYAFHKYNNDYTKFIIATDQMNIKSNSLNVITIQHGIGFDIPGYMIRGFWSKIRKLQFINKYLRCVRNVQRFYHTKTTVCVDYNYYNWFRTLGTIYPEYKLNVIPNYASDFIKEEELENKLDNKRKTRKIVFARRFVDYRGTLLFAQVVKRIIEEFDIDITFAGDGPLKKTLESIFNGYKNVHFTSFAAPDSVKFHKDYDIAVIPTIFSEGTSLSLCEAMASGCFPIATHVGGITNIILDGYNGYLCQPNENSLYQRIKQCLLLEENEFNEIVKNAYYSCLKAFSISKWENSWKKILGTDNF